MNKKITDFVISGRRRSHFIQWRVWLRGSQIRQMPKSAGSGQLPPEFIFYFLPFPPPTKKFDKTKKKRSQISPQQKNKNPNPEYTFWGKIKKVTL